MCNNDADLRYSVSLPSLGEMSEGFYINSTVPSNDDTSVLFDCTFFDNLYYTSSPLRATPERYLCTSHYSSSLDDIALHYRPAKEQDKGSSFSGLPLPAMIVIIIVSIIVGLGVSAFLIRRFCCGRGRLSGGRRRNMEEESVRSAVRTRYGRTRRNRSAGRESEDKLPPYRRHGHPGEVPPGYIHEDAPGYEETIAAGSTVVGTIEEEAVAVQAPERTAARESMREVDVEAAGGEHSRRTMLRSMLPRFRH